MDETLFSDIENALHTSDFQVVGEEIIASVESAFESTKICVERMADEFLAELQKNPEFDLFFREEADAFAALKGSCIESWKKELSNRENEVAKKLISYFDAKLTRHSHRIINIKNAMSGKVMRLRESVIQYRAGHEIKGEERIKEHNRLVVEMIRSEKDAELAELKERVKTLESRLKTAQVTRLSDPTYRHLIADHQVAMDRAALNIEGSIEEVTARKLLAKPCEGCAALQERVDELERAVAMNDASSQDSSSVGIINSNRIVRPSQIVMSRRGGNAASDDDDDDDSTAADSISVLSEKSSKLKSKDDRKGKSQRMSRVSMIKVQGAKNTAPVSGGAAFRGRQRTELTPVRGGQRQSIAQGGPVVHGELLEEDDEEDEEGPLLGAVSAPVSVLSVEPVAVADVPAADEPVVEEPAAEMPREEPEPEPEAESAAVEAVKAESVAIAVDPLPKSPPEPQLEQVDEQIVLEQPTGAKSPEALASEQPTPPAVAVQAAEAPAAVAAEAPATAESKPPVRKARSSIIHHQPAGGKHPIKSPIAPEHALVNEPAQTTAPAADDEPVHVEEAVNPSIKAAVIVSDKKIEQEASNSVQNQKENGDKIPDKQQPPQPHLESHGKRHKEAHDKKHEKATDKSEVESRSRPNSGKHGRTELQSKAKQMEQVKDEVHSKKPSTREHSSGTTAGVEASEPDHNHNPEKMHKPQHKKVKHHSVECQTDALPEECAPQPGALLAEPAAEVFSQTDPVDALDVHCQTDAELAPMAIFPPVPQERAHAQPQTDHPQRKAHRFSPRSEHAFVPGRHAIDSPDPFASPEPDDGGLRFGVVFRSSADAEDGPAEGVLVLEEKVKSLSEKLDAAAVEQGLLEKNNSILQEKLDFTEEMNLHQGQLFTLKLKERALLLKELSNQVNILRSEAAKRERVLQAQAARVSPELAVPLQQAQVSRGKGDITADGTRDRIQPVTQRPPSAPGLSVPPPKELWNIRLDEGQDAPRPKTANPPMRGAPLTYNTPATSLLKEAVPISTRIKQGKVGSFSHGLNKSHSSSKVKPSPPMQNTAHALREACHLSQPKMDMFSSSGGKFGRAHSDGGSLRQRQRSDLFHSSEVHELFAREDILISAHDEIKEIRQKIGDLLHDHEKLNQRRSDIERRTAVSSPARARSVSTPGSGQRVRSPLRSRPTSPPSLEKFMQFGRLSGGGL